MSCFLLFVTLTKLNFSECGTWVENWVMGRNGTVEIRSVPGMWTVHCNMTVCTNRRRDTFAVQFEGVQLGHDLRRHLILTLLSEPQHEIGSSYQVASLLFVKNRKHNLERVKLYGTGTEVRFIIGDRVCV